MYAIRKNNYQLVKLLLDYHADCTLQDSAGRTALMSAALNGNTKAVKLILTYDKKNVNSQNTDQDFCLISND